MDTRKKLYSNVERLMNHSLSILYRFLFFVFIFGFCANVTICKSASAEIRPQIQELHGFLEDDRGTVYTLNNLKKGDTLYVYMTNTSGNLDPMLGLFKKRERS